MHMSNMSFPVQVILIPVQLLESSILDNENQDMHAFGSRERGLLCTVIP